MRQPLCNRQIGVLQGLINRFSLWCLQLPKLSNQYGAGHLTQSTTTDAISYPEKIWRAAGVTVLVERSAQAWQ